MNDLGFSLASRRYVTTYFNSLWCGELGQVSPTYGLTNVSHDRANKMDIGDLFSAFYRAEGCKLQRVLALVVVRWVEREYVIHF
jgi:hypothetical protein